MTHSGFATTKGGYGGKVARVTNLNDGGDGSLRAALDGATGPTIIVPEISGELCPSSTLYLRNPYVSLEFQCAPSPGFTIRGVSFRIQAGNVKARHFRTRVGDRGIPGTQDGVWIEKGEGNVWFDRSSFAWSIDENISVGGGLDACTISNSIIAEALSKSLNTKGEHSKGSLLNVRSKRSVCHGNLYAHNRERNPQVSHSTSFVVMNCVNYNPGSAKGAIYVSATGTVSEPTPGTVIGSIVANVHIPGKNSPVMKPIWLRVGTATGTKIYCDDWSQVQHDCTSLMQVNAPPIWPAGLVALPRDEVLAAVLSNAGARAADRDAVDKRIVQDVRAGTGYIINSPNDVGGWPVLAVNKRPLQLPTDPYGLQRFLDDMAVQVEGGAPSEPSIEELQQRIAALEAELAVSEAKGRSMVAVVGRAEDELDVAARHLAAGQAALAEITTAGGTVRAQLRLTGTHGAPDRVVDLVQTSHGLELRAAPVSQGHGCPDHADAPDPECADCREMEAGDG